MADYLFERPESENGETIIAGAARLASLISARLQAIRGSGRWHHDAPPSLFNEAERLLREAFPDGTPKPH